MPEILLKFILFICLFCFVCLSFRFGFFFLHECDIDITAESKRWVIRLKPYLTQRRGLAERIAIGYQLTIIGYDTIRSNCISKFLCTYTHAYAAKLMDQFLVAIPNTFAHQQLSCHPSRCWLVILQSKYTHKQYMNKREHKSTHIHRHTHKLTQPTTRLLFLRLHVRASSSSLLYDPHPAILPHIHNPLS